jgi:hypothetical protein
MNYRTLSPITDKPTSDSAYLNSGANRAFSVPRERAKTAQRRQRTDRAQVIA